MSDLVALPSLIFPPIKADVASDGDGLTIYDIVRKRRVALTPEEWVRQHVIHWLAYHRGYPAGRASVERSIGPSGMRFDVVWHDATGAPWLLIECKAPSIAVTSDTLRQSAWYNLTIRAPYVLLTNGNAAFCARVERDGAMEFIPDIPPYPVTS
ncbi:MAG: type I restriction enzyme HsdR N-terminal domain-containing protein [Candidatus Kapabacteria bacterium]|jgi:hypothetical protein|nr:type I restriction enzyme HsdR N-terminal domain-containing protein [Candidatus Kapabacteria bacterium]